MDELKQLKNKGMSISAKIDHLQDELTGLMAELEEIDNQIEILEAEEENHGN